MMALHDDLGKGIRQVPPVKFGGATDFSIEGVSKVRRKTRVAFRNCLESKESLSPLSKMLAEQPKDIGKGTRIPVG